MSDEIEREMENAWMSLAGDDAPCPIITRRVAFDYGFKAAWKYWQNKEAALVEEAVKRLEERTVDR